MPRIETVWPRIEAHAGQAFRQIRGAEFKYAIVAGCVRPDRTNRLIPKSNFEEALAHVPLANTVPLQRLQGPSYIYAILMDKRVRANEW